MHDKWHRDTRGRFVSDIDHLLARFRSSLTSARARARDVETESQTCSRRREAILDRKLGELLPDLSTATVARLKRDCPSFVTKSMQQAIANAASVRIPFITWLFGGATTYRTEAVSKQLELTRVQLRKWLDQQRPRTASLSEVSLLETEINKLQEEKRTIRQTISQLESQIEGLEANKEHYANPKASEPPANLREAVTNSAEKLRSTPSAQPNQKSSTVVVHQSSGMSMMDYFILDSLLNHRYRDEGYNHHTTGTNSPGFTNPTSMESSREDSPRFGGGSVELGNDSNESTRFSGGSFKVSSDNDTRFGGGSQNVGSFS